MFHEESMIQFWYKYVIPTIGWMIDINNKIVKYCPPNSKKHVSDKMGG